VSRRWPVWARRRTSCTARSRWGIPAIGLNDPEKAKEYFANLSEGGTVIMALEKTFWAEAFGMLTDKFGIKWMVNCDSPK
jgi:uncharacterized glyoxalase superfamily protein PhnB